MTQKRNIATQAEVLKIYSTVIAAKRDYQNLTAHEAAAKLVNLGFKNATVGLIETVFKEAGIQLKKRRHYAPRNALTSKGSRDLAKLVRKLATAIEYEWSKEDSEMLNAVCNGTVKEELKC